MMSGQPIELVSTLGGFRLASFALFGWRLFEVGLLADILELPLPGLPVSQNNSRVPARTIEIEHRLIHLSRPFGTLFEQIGQFPEQEHVGTALRRNKTPNYHAQPGYENL
jgi:hypothetical protein